RSAAVTLGSDAYYWRNFFTPTGPVAPATTGPYRFLRNPMYTVGYLQTYGLALLVGSRFGLIMALFDQAAILVFYRRVEKPHFDKLDRQARTAQNQASPIRSHDPWSPSSLPRGVPCATSRRALPRGHIPLA